MKLRYGFPLSPVIMSLVEYEYLRKRFSQVSTFVLPCGCRTLMPKAPKNMVKAIINAYSEIFIYDEYSRLPEYQVCEGDVVLDVGAFVGLYTLMVVHKAKLVVAVEPNVIASYFLKRNIQLNGLNQKVIVVNKALADYEGKAMLYIEDYLPSSSTLFRQWHEEYGHSTSALVKVTKLDNLLADLGIENIDLMKLDVEGAELSVLRGATETLKNHVIQRVVMEIHPKICNPVRVISFLRKHGYGIDLLEKRRDTMLLYSRLR